MTGLERLSKFKHEREINNKKPVENITPPDDSLDTIKTEALARVVNDLAPDFSPRPLKSAAEPGTGDQGAGSYHSGANRKR